MWSSVLRAGARALPAAAAVSSLAASRPRREQPRLQVALGQPLHRAVGSHLVACEQKPAAGATADPSTPLDVRLGLTSPSGTSHKLGWGILGAGDISSDWAKSLKDVPGARLASVAARSPEKAKKFAKEHGVAKSVATYAELVADPEVDIVYVGTVTPLHKEHTLLAIRAGKHVLCEKPIAMTSAEAREMYEAAEQAGVMLQEGMWTRFFPAVDHARVLLEQGAIGEVTAVQADFPDKCYAVQAAPLAFGADAAPSLVVATGGPCDAANGAVAQYGARGCAVFTFPRWDSEYPETIDIIGKKGRLTLGPWGHHPTMLTVRLTPPECLDARTVGGAMGHTSTSQNGVSPHTSHFEYPIPYPAGPPLPGGWHFSNQHGFVYQAEAIHRCLAAGLRGCPQFTKAESLHVMGILDAEAEQCAKASAAA